MAAPNLLTVEDMTGEPRRRRRERIVSSVLLGAAFVSLVVSVGIVVALLTEGWLFLSEVRLDQLWGDQWAPPFLEFDLKTPIVGSGCRNVASSEATMMSARRATSNPPPWQLP